MIIRILSEGQFELPDDALDGLNELDSTLEAAVEAGDEAAVGKALEALLSRVREGGTPVAVDALVASTLLLPFSGASLAEVRELINDDGFIPG